MSKLIDSLKIKAKLLQKAKIKKQPDFKLKQAYEILALAAGYASWREWKEILDEHQIFAPPGAAIWHVWYSNLEEAQLHLTTTSNTFLIPHQKHFFICDQNYVKTLGIDANDTDLKLVGRNWATPMDYDAWERMLKKISQSRSR